MVDCALKITEISVFSCYACSCHILLLLLLLLLLAVVVVGGGDGGDCDGGGGDVSICYLCHYLFSSSGS